MITATRQDSRFYTHKLPNGLQLLGQYMPGTQSATPIFWVKTGTRDEPAEEMGVSHFLEHMAFRRSKQLTGNEIDRAFEEMGADHNAGTWLDMTFYWARVLRENVGWAIQVVGDLTQPVLDEQDFNGERPVILEEIARYEDIPTHVLVAHFMQDYFGSNPLARETLGTPETIKALTVEQMREYWQRRYGTENMVFAIAGNFDWETVVQEVETLSRDWHRGESGRTAGEVTFQPGLHVIQREKFAQEQVAIGVPSVSRGDPRYFAADVLATILGDDTGSRLYWALHEPGLAESATAQVMAFDDAGLMLLHLATEPDKAEEALRVARAELKVLQDSAIQPEELERAKAKLVSSVVIGGESTYARAMAIVRSWLVYGRLQTLEEVRQQIEAVTLDDLHGLLRDCAVEPAQVITAVGPLPESAFDSHGDLTFGA